MFVAFYSYKGGVGRTMALANVACLLAGDEEHPQRVLVWDFDLEAPGLHKLFPPNELRKFGFVDMAHEFVETGNMPDVRDYIYASDVPKLDVLPAGVVEASYCEKLQAIDWAGFFAGDGEKCFFDVLKKNIRELSYDYVLIDSRTGLNDQAGICTQVLPEMLVCLFRPTAQNLDGLEHVIPVIRKQQKQRISTPVPILGIASVVTSTSSSDILTERDKAKRLFEREPLEYIRFDPDLAREETLFCRGGRYRDMWPKPSIVGDYQRLESRVRQKNENDTKTRTTQLRKRWRKGDLASAEPILLSVLRERPRLRELWRRFGQLLEDNPTPSRRDKFRQEVNRILENDAENSHAIEWKARLLLYEAEDPEVEKVLTEALGLLQEAILYDSNREDLHHLIAIISACNGMLEEAVVSLRKALALSPDNAEYLLTLVDLQMRRGARFFATAIEILEGLRDELGSQKWVTMAYLHTYFGEDDKAEQALYRLESGPKEWDPKREQLFKAHLLVIRGQVEQGLALAAEAIESSKSEADFSELCNWAELHVCAEQFDKAIEILREFPSDCAKCITELARYLKGGSDPPLRNDVLKLWKGELWGFRELIIFRERLWRDKKSEYGDRLEIIELLVQQNDLEWHR